ncbi:hypothetical protein [Geobacter grbiciae]|uniref:hypothetical protein n=1 Tax=Geobacter grbiciae TaxID=155042 RepID=UPI001C0179F0|nr:hypothetical protein [Geobacter grbiciae]
MIKAALVAAMVLGSTLPAWGERLWLVVGTSDRTATGIARKAKAVVPTAPNALVVRTGDCGDKRSIFAWVPEIAASPGAARAALSRVRATAKDAYVKRCNARPGTLLALRVTAVDPSVANVPETAVNWEEKDRISTAHPLPDGRSIVIVRSFAPTADDPLEGRRESVMLAEPSGKRLVLEENCPSPGPMATQQGRIAFHCARQEAGNHLLHDVVVFGRSGEKLAEIRRCRDPKWAGSQAIECREESVDAEGALQLRTKRIALPPTNSP